MASPYKNLTSTGLVLACLAGMANADSVSKWDTASDAMALGLPALALWLTHHHQDTAGTGQLALSLGSTVAAVQVLKNAVHAQRPDGSDNKSFPSGHTAVAFSAASHIDRRYGQQHVALVPVVYGVAALTGVARVQAQQHYWRDVLVGGAIGYGASRIWTSPVHSGRLSLLPTPGGMALGWQRTF